MFTVYLSIHRFGRTDKLELLNIISRIIASGIDLENSLRAGEYKFNEVKNFFVFIVKIDSKLSILVLKNKHNWINVILCLKIWSILKHRVGKNTQSRHITHTLVQARGCGYTRMQTSKDFRLQTSRAFRYYGGRVVIDWIRE